MTPLDAGRLVKNQRQLGAALARVSALLAAFTGQDDAPPPPEPDIAGSALALVCERFGLSAFERDVLLLAAGVELDGALGTLCARAQGEPQRAQPTFSLALAALPQAAWSSLGPFAPLRYWHLIEVEKGGTLVGGALRVDESILHLLAGMPHVDERLAALLEPDIPGEHLSDSQRALVARMVAAWEGGAGTRLVLQLCGDDVVAKRGLAAALADACGRELLVVRAPALPTVPAEADLLLRLCERHVVLHDACVLLECDGLDPADGARELAVARMVERFAGPLVVGSAQRRRDHVRPLIPFDVARPSRAEQARHWAGLIGGQAADATGGQLAAQFDASLAAIERSWIAAGRSGDPAALWAAARTQARPRLDELAQRIEPRASWDDLVVPAEVRRTLERIVAQVRYRWVVHDTWGFGAQSERGLGIAALFAGPSGTGKTFAAEVIARQVELDLYRIDLSAVVSKYIGETEKNLRRVFDAAEAGGAILLFDEADALFGQRSEVKDSHDRYANLEVSYLLQRVEAYRGLAILTTNLKDALDSAFARRLHHVVAFPFPDQAQRAEIWRRTFPPAAPTAALDVTRLAQLSVAGGTIRTIALDAAFRAAAQNRPVTMSDVLDAARTEYRKLDRTLAEREIAGWAAAAAAGVPA